MMAQGERKTGNNPPGAADRMSHAGCGMRAADRGWDMGWEVARRTWSRMNGHIRVLSGFARLNAVALDPRLAHTPSTAECLFISPLLRLAFGCYSVCM